MGRINVENVDRWETGSSDATPDDLRDRDLVILAQAGDDVALEMILSKYSPATRSKAYRFFMQGADRDDVVQEAMIGLFKAVRDYDPARCTKFRVFAALCINRQVMTAVKIAARSKHGPLNSAGSLDELGARTSSTPVLAAPATYDPAVLVAANDDIEQLEKTLSKQLSQMEAATLELYIDGKTYEEIAQHLGSRSKAVDNAIQRVRAKVKRYLKDQNLFDADPVPYGVRRISAAS
ncbi:MAG: sigma-70 family RNA polymerase sigma factor [Actinomycetota bacterium]